MGFKDERKGVKMGEKGWVIERQMDKIICEKRSEEEVWKHLFIAHSGYLSFGRTSDIFRSNNKIICTVISDFNILKSCSFMVKF